MKKICLLYRYDLAGHVVIRQQIRTFIEGGYEVASIDQGIDESMPKALDHEHVRIPRQDWGLLTRPLWALVRRVKSPRLDHGFWSALLRLRSLSNAVLLAQAAARQRPDCYIAHDLLSARAALLACRLVRRPVFYDAHEIESEQGAGEAVEIQRAFLRSLEQRVIPEVDHLVVPNRARGDWYREQYGTRRDPVMVRNCPPKQAALESNKLREVLGLGGSVRIVLYHGALIPHRALDNLVRSAALFDDHIVLVFVGEQGDYYRDVLRPLVEVEKLEHRVFFLPYVEHNEVPSYVASADLGVVIYENVNLNNYFCAPTKLYEYIMMEVPVVACAFPGLVDLMERYPVGRTFDPEDPLSIARAINNHFSGDPEKGRKIESALAEARLRFNWETESQKWLTLLNGMRTQ